MYAKVFRVKNKRDLEQTVNLESDDEDVLLDQDNEDGSSTNEVRQEKKHNCPELVRVQNCMKWHQMKSVSTEVPRVAHADDIHDRRVHVYGRANHYVCGVMAVENLLTHQRCCLGVVSACTPKKGLFGMELNSPSIM
jgi:hypothetical protein